MALSWLSHLLPKSPLWRSSASVLRIFDGAQAWFDEARDLFDFGMLENRPVTTTDVFERLQKNGISARFLTGLSETDARNLLIAMEPRSPGQSPLRLQDILHAAGFTDVFVHEWFEPGTGPSWTERSAGAYLQSIISGLCHCDDEWATCDDDLAYCDDFVYSGGNWLTNKTVYAGGKLAHFPNDYRGLFYICGETFGEIVSVDEAKRELLEYLILRYKRASLWAVIINETPPEYVDESGNFYVDESSKNYVMGL
jgi:hypothetical protein